VFLTVKPSPRLAPFVDFLWFDATHVAHTTETVLPSSRVQILVGLSAETDALLAPVVAGPRTRPATIATAPMRRIAGAVLLPGAAAELLGVSARALTEHDVPLAELWDDAEALWAALVGSDSPTSALETFDAALAKHAETPPSRLVRFATAQLDAGATVRATIDATGRSRSSVVRAFDRHVGLTPKRYARLGRFSRAVERVAANEDLAEVALACGFADQAHLCHEFRRFAERSPTAYRPRDEHAPNHVR
jgi:AraC-like DNA-binding protein